MTYVSTSENGVYGRGGGRELRCDVYTPADRPDGAACVLLLHGGGWSGGNRGIMRDFGERLAGAGFVCVAPEYRLTGESPWPAQIEDVAAAIRWCRSRATQLGIDAGKIAAMGFSAGGHLALLAAGLAGPHPGPLKILGEGVSLAAVAAVYPPVLFYTGGTRPSGASPAESLMGEAATEDLARDASPLTYVQAGFPPTFLLHGTADTVVPPSASRVFYDALVQAGVPAEMHLYAGQPHGFARRPEFVDLVAAEAAHFLQRQLATIATPVASGRA